MNKKLRVIIIEDSEFDAIIMAEVLEQGGYELDYERVETPDELKEALSDREWDLILSDYNLPDFNAPAALEIVKSTGLDLPFIIISGGIGEDVAVAAMKSGAHDYLMKGRLARLVVAVERELGDVATRKARKKAEGDLRENELRYRLLWENSNDGVVLMDQEGNILFTNPAISQMFGHSSDALLGKRLSMLISEDQDLGFDTDAPISNFTSKHLQEVVGNRQDDSQFPVEMSCSSLEMHGRLMIAAFLRDITERKQAQLELEVHEERLKTAREIQQWMFPKVPPTLEGYDIAGVSFPAEAAGGDHFDYLPMTRGRLGLVVADVTGHGIGPALLMSEARAYLRILALNREETGEILTRANAVLSDDLNFERYITVVLICLEAEKRRLTFSNAGHPAALVVDESGQIKAHLKRNGVPLGIRAKTSYSTSDYLSLDSGDMVFLYTDGFDEAMAENESFFGIDKIVQILHQFRMLPSREILQKLYQSVDEFTGDQPQADDLTGILVKVS